MIRVFVLGSVFLFSGCALAPLIVGAAVDGTVGGIGIWQREQHRKELRDLNDQVYRMRVPPVLPTAEILRDREER